MTPKQDESEKNQPQLKFLQSIFSHVQATAIHVGRITQIIIYVSIGSPNKKQRRFSLVIFLALSITLIIAGFVNLRNEGIILQTQLLLGSGCILPFFVGLYYIGFWKPDIPHEQHEKRRSKILIRKRLAAIFMVSIPLVTAVGVCVWWIAPTDNTIVTFAEYFEPDPAARNAITGRLREKLRNATYNSNTQDIVIEDINRAFSDGQRDKAIREGNQKKATIAIWGWVWKNAEYPINTTVELLKQPLLVSISDTAKKLRVGDETTKWFRYSIGLKEVDIDIVSNPNDKSDTDHELAYLVNFISGLAQYKAGNWQQAIKRFDIALKNIESVKQSTLHLKQSIVYFYRSNAHLSDTYSKSKKSYDLAIDGFTRAIELIPESSLAFYNRSNLNFGQYDHSVILASYKVSQLGSGIDKTDDQEIICGNQKRDTNVIVDNSPSKLKAYLARVYYNRGLSYALAGDNDKALSDYVKAFQFDPEVDGLCIGLGSAYASKGKYNLAIQNLEQAIRVNPKDALAHNNLGNVYVSASQYDYQQAITQYEKAIRLKPDFGDAYYNQARVYLKQEEYALALKYFDKALKLQPNLANAYIGRADVFFNDKDYVNAENYNKAVKEYSTAISIAPENAQLYLIRGIAYQANKDYELAIKDFQQVISLKQYFAYADAYLGLATSYMELGDRLKEKDNYQKFYNLTKNLPDDIRDSMVEEHISKYRQMRRDITLFQTKNQCNLLCSIWNLFSTTTGIGTPNPRRGSPKPIPRGG